MVFSALTILLRYFAVTSYTTLRDECMCMCLMEYYFQMKWQLRRFLTPLGNITSFIVTSFYISFTNTYIHSLIYIRMYVCLYILHRQKLSIVVNWKFIICLVADFYCVSAKCVSGKKFTIKIPKRIDSIFVSASSGTKTTTTTELIVRKWHAFDGVWAIGKM